MSPRYRGGTNLPGAEGGPEMPAVPEDALAAMVASEPQYQYEDNTLEINWDSQAREDLTAAWPATGRAWLEWAAEDFDGLALADEENGNPVAAAVRRANAHHLRTLAANLPDAP